MLDATRLFPQGHALGEAFCDRETERERLKNCFLNNENTVIVAPRRYGKSSLIRQALLETEIAGRRIDLLPATNMLFVNKAIRFTFSELLNEIAPKIKSAKQNLIDFVKSLHPKLSLNVFGQTFEVTTGQASESSISELLVGLNTAAAKVKKRLVICFDEFQQVGFLKNNNSIEAAIRHAVESTSNITYIFSGSNRHLLTQMFSSKSRPLYHLCELMELGRIKPEIYYPILAERAKQKWKKIHVDDFIAEIINATKCHPYYVNALCRQLWKMESCPGIVDVQKAWLIYIDSQSNWVTNDLSRLSPNQRNILAALAFQPTQEPYGNEFCDRVKLGASSVSKSLNILLKADFVYKDKSKYYKVLDPAIETYMHQIKYFDFLDN